MNKLHDEDLERYAAFAGKLDKGEVVEQIKMWQRVKAVLDEEHRDREETFKMVEKKLSILNSLSL